MGRASVWVLGLGAVVILGGFQIWLPHRAERALEEALTRSGVAVQGAKATVWSFPASELFLGHVDRLRLELTGVESEVPVKSAELDMTGISFNASAILAGERLQISSVDGGRCVVTITEGALNTYLSRTTGAGTAVSAKLTGGLGLIRGSFKVAGLELELALQGKFTPAGSGVKFIPRDFSVMNASVPKFILGELASQLTINIPLGDLPIPMEVLEVKAESGELQVVAVPVKPGSVPGR